MPIAALIEIILNTALSLYTTMKGSSSDTALIAKLLPVAGQVYDSLTLVNTTLAKAQTEAWTDGDPRWLPIFAAVHQAISAAEATVI